MRRPFGFLLAVLVSFALVPSPGAGAAPALPRNIAAIGDSITRAFDVCCWYGDHPSHSWSTGWAPFDGISSHYERIVVHEPLSFGDYYNDAVSGARMSDGPRQAGLAVSQSADYVTILMGANDVCTSSRSTMTSVATFQSEFQSTLSTLENGLPSGSHVFVASIPNVYHLWLIYHTSSVARFVWSTANICQSMLSSANTEADRQAVLQREESFNTVLAEGCAAYANCRFDGGAVFGYPFTRDQVSTLDFFHPDLSGQAVLADVTWAASWWPDL
jgi:lysophospholipase L1-like esterase